LEKVQRLARWILVLVPYGGARNAQLSTLGEDRLMQWLALPRVIFTKMDA
jgi:hypothetical protein